MTVDEFVNELNSKGFTASFTDNKLSVNGVGDSYVLNPLIENVFKLQNVEKDYRDRKINTESDYQTYEKNIISELGNIYAPGKINMQIGPSADEYSTLSVQTAFKLVGYNDFRQIGKNNVNYLEQLDDLLESISIQQVELGAMQNRLESVIESIMITRDNMISTRSTLRDADIAEESSNYIANQILQQASATLLATANQTPQIALQLL